MTVSAMIGKESDENLRYKKMCSIYKLRNSFASLIAMFAELATLATLCFVWPIFCYSL